MASDSSSVSGGGLLKLQYIEDRAARRFWRRAWWRVLVKAWWKPVASLVAAVIVLVVPVFFLPTPAENSGGSLGEPLAIAITAGFLLIAVVGWSIAASGSKKPVVHEYPLLYTDFMPERVLGLPELVHTVFGDDVPVIQRELFGGLRKTGGYAVAGMVYADIGGRRYFLAAWDEHMKLVELPIGGELDLDAALARPTAHGGARLPVWSAGVSV